MGDFLLGKRKERRHTGDKKKGRKAPFLIVLQRFDAELIATCLERESTTLRQLHGRTSERGSVRSGLVEELGPE